MLDYNTFTLLNESFDYLEAHRIAQENASKPIKDGGLGLHKDNTSLERAKAMGYVLKAYHGTGSDIHYFDKSKAHDKEGRSRSLGYGKDKFYLSTSSEVASNWANRAPNRGDKYGSGVHPNVLPLLVRVNKSIPEYEYQTRLEHHSNSSDYAFFTQKQHDLAVSKTDKEMKKNKVNVIIGEHQIVVYNPEDIRSIHAAFDPMKNKSHNLLESIYN